MPWRLPMCSLPWQSESSHVPMSSRASPRRSRRCTAFASCCMSSNSLRSACVARRSISLEPGDLSVAAWSSSQRLPKCSLSSWSERSHACISSFRRFLAACHCPRSMHRNTWKFQSLSLCFRRAWLPASLLDFLRLALLVARRAIRAARPVHGMSPSGLWSCPCSCSFFWSTLNGWHSGFVTDGDTD